MTTFTILIVIAIVFAIRAIYLTKKESNDRRGRRRY